MGRSEGIGSAPGPPAYMPPGRGSSPHLSAACSDGLSVCPLQGLPLSPGCSLGYRAQVGQVGGNRRGLIPGLSSDFPRGTCFAAGCLGKRSNKFTASLMSNLLSGALRKQRTELTKLN